MAAESRPGGGTPARRPRVFSGIQPSGDVHLGNYLGAIQRWAAGQADKENYFCVVDLHSLTVPQEPELLRQQTRSLAAMLLAAGLDPGQCTLFVQSHVSAHAEACWLLNCVTPIGWLHRMTQYKDRAARQESVGAGLLDYPVLMAADILLYDTDEVPVGEDQRQHVEITRDIAIRFNHRFGDTFVVPEAVMPASGARVMSLQDPTSKMSKSDESEAGCVYLTDEPAAIMKKFKRAVTDSETGADAVRFDRAAKPGVSSLLEINASVTGRTPQQVAESHEQYGSLKVETGEAVVAELEPIRLRYLELMEDRGELARLLRVGSGKARTVASATLDRAHRAIGMLPA